MAAQGTQEGPGLLWGRDCLRHRQLAFGVLLGPCISPVARAPHVLSEVAGARGSPTSGRRSTCAVTLLDRVTPGLSALHSPTVVEHRWLPLQNQSPTQVPGRHTLRSRYGGPP
jgi:hypothetical protein